MKSIWRLLRYDWPLHFVLLFTNWLPDNVIFLRFRGYCARPFFGRCGRNLRLARHTHFYNPALISLGNDVYASHFCTIIAGGSITVEDGVLVGPFNVLVSGKHTKQSGSYRWGTPVFEPITIGSGSWLASHVTVVGGVKVGRGVLVGANSVVTTNVADDLVVGGVPARQLSSKEVALA